MNWEAFFAIGLFTLVLGALLYIPAHFWIKRKLRKEQKIAVFSNPIDKNLHVTKAGFILVGLSIGTIVFAIGYIKTETTFAELIDTPGVRQLFFILVGLPFIFIAAILTKMGIKLVKKKNEDV